MKIRFVYTIQKSSCEYYIGSCTLNSQPVEFYGQSSTPDYLPEIVKSQNYKVNILHYCSNAQELKECLKKTILLYSNFTLVTSIQEHKDKISKSLKEKWNDPTYIDKQIQIRSSSSYKEKLSTSRKNMFIQKGEDISIQMSFLVRNTRWSDNSKREEQSLILKKKWEDPEFRDKLIKRD